MSLPSRHLVSVDVGSRSVRSGIFDATGALKGRATQAISVATPEPLHFEQSTDEMWRAVCATVRAAMAESGVDPSTVAGIGFDATSSVALFKPDGGAASISTTGDDNLNVVMWCDHRAAAEAREIDATGHGALGFVGGSMSPEMVLPKLMWLKRHAPVQWSRYGLALDLTDFLAWRATGCIHASTCTITCKWTFHAHEAAGWKVDLLESIGLGDLFTRLQLPGHGRPIGSAVAPLSALAARELGLPQSCIVAAGLIDAHAGCMGPLGALPADALDHDIAVIAGTSNCLMSLSPGPRFVPGVWGPYLGTLRPGLWLNEGGLSATGAALDHVLSLTAEGRALGPGAHEAVTAEIVQRIGSGAMGPVARYLVVPDFNGNRSPLARPTARAIVAGLDLDGSRDGLLELYYATAIGIALGTRHVVDALDAAGYDVQRIHLSGGHARSPLLVQLYADATGCEVLPSAGDDGVLAGNAINAAAATGIHPDIETAAAAMWRSPPPVRPDPLRREALEKEHRHYLAVQAAMRERPS